MSDRCCQGCGTLFVAAHGNRKWCSERCRKRQYDRVCVGCGGRVDGTSPGRAAAEPRCRACRDEYRRANAVWTREAIVCAIQEWAARNDGIPPSAGNWGQDRARGDNRVCAVNHVMNRWGTWSAAIRAAGFEPRAPGPVGGFTRLTDRQRAEIPRLYEQGWSLTQLAARYQCSSDTVRRWVLVAGVRMRRPGSRHGRAVA